MEGRKAKACKRALIRQFYISKIVCNVCGRTEACKRVLTYQLDRLSGLNVFCRKAEARFRALK